MTALQSDSAPAPPAGLPPSRSLPARVTALRRLALAGAALVLGAGLLGASFHLSRSAARHELQQSQDIALRTRVQALTAVLSRQRAVATVLADDGAMQQALAAPPGALRIAASQKLARLRARTESAVIYLLDRHGVAVAASNWQEPTSFVGKDYSFRAYFRDALNGAQGTQFALGTVSNRPGLYLSQRLSGGPGGVIVVKVEFDAIEQGWRDGQVRTRVVDRAGRVVLADEPALRFGPPPPPGRGQIVSAAAVPGTDWTMILLGPGGPALRVALLGTGSAAFLLTLSAGAAARAMRARRRAARAAEAQRRYRADLERAVAERTRALSDEMAQRRAAEARLARLQAEMEQANRLAALGQITAGVAHEVNQPLATIRLLAENGAALLVPGQAPEVAGNLASIARMADRIAAITDRLRGFARKGEGGLHPVPLAGAIEAALLLTASGREAQGTLISLPAIPPDLRVTAETVRLEQILVNLLRNAQEALAGRAGGRITLGLELTADRVRVEVADNGPGLDPAIAGRLFVPFATSKAGGLGLGLVISQEIARAFGGSLAARPRPPGQGAAFVLELRRAP